jgi:hypothetical protein
MCGGRESGKREDRMDEHTAVPILSVYLSLSAIMAQSSYRPGNPGLEAYGLVIIQRTTV